MKPFSYQQHSSFVSRELQKKARGEKFNGKVCREAQKANCLGLNVVQEEGASQNILCRKVGSFIIIKSYHGKRL